jgi:hypothetical protein
MAKGLKCQNCKEVMYALEEDHQAQGTWVTYLCRNGGCASAKAGQPFKEKVFEAK